jgi:hypothetical protein
VAVSHEGYSIQCRVNDRGPFVHGRVIDLSVSAATMVVRRRRSFLGVLDPWSSCRLDAPYSQRCDTWRQ